VISHKTNLGVGASFMSGVRTCMSMNAGIVVTLDADSQFDPNEISKLIVPILNNELDVVIGSRFLNGRPNNMPKIKFFGNKVFTKIVSWVTGQKFSDTQTGFRAYSKDAIPLISIVNDFTYTQEVLIDLKFKGLKIGEVPIFVSYDDKRKSRVVKNIFNYSSRALSIILRSLIYHKPIFSFGILGSFLIVIGVLSKIATISNIFHITSGLSTGLIILGIVSFMMGLFASVVFKRQSFAEKDMRHYVKNSEENRK
jgi:glycosyltransferase involved in cell wall biosynthesis